ncbi:MAG: hypothetical protein L6Q76_29235 [Polyangiaceae bacterium]|nr:hypothetical protein [Polyangiaceae bacterium]
MTTLSTRPKLLRRAALASLAALMVGAPCCGGGNLGSPSEVTELRVLAVTADKPYAAPGDMVTFRLTYADALGDEPRALSVQWLGGCVNPIGDDYLGCFPQFLGPNTIIQSDMVPAELSGVPDAVSFSMPIPKDVLAAPRIAESGVPFSEAYAFFIVCAGTIQFTDQAEGFESFPLECVDGATGKKLGAESFVVGYTQVYVFADGRSNTNPPVLGLTLDGAEMPEDAESAPVVPKCAAAKESEEEGGCNQDAADDCKTFKIQATVEDVAEFDPESSETGDAVVKEAIWIDYFTDKGDITGFRQLVNDPATGYKPVHATEFTPPAEPGLVNLWAVVHDARGGSSVIRRVVRVE